MRNLIYVSMLMSPSLCRERNRQGNYFFNAAAQKFHSLITTGITDGVPEVELSVLSGLYPDGKRWIQRRGEERESGIRFQYIPYLNIPFLRTLIQITVGFIKLVRLHRRGSDETIILDPLLFYLLLPTWIFAKLFRVKLAIVVTDLIGYLGPVGHHVTWKNAFFKKIFVYLCANCDGYIVLTEQMCDIINPKHRSYMLMEGVVDHTISPSTDFSVPPSEPPIILYAGGLLEEYGVRLLIEAFQKIRISTVELHIYGGGPMAEEIKTISADKNSRIRYFGMRTMEEVLNAEKSASLLINPRAVPYEFTKYSFPSKNLEFLSTGTPILAAMLPGIPEEYREIMYIIREATAESLGSQMEEILNFPLEERLSLGRKAQRYVLKKKNNLCQAKRIFNYLATILNP